MFCFFFCPGEKSGSRNRAVPPSFPLLTVSVFHICQKGEGRKKEREERLMFVMGVQAGQGREGREVADVFKSAWC